VQQWEYALLAESPGGPTVMTLTIYRLKGAQKTVYQAVSYDEGSQALRPRLLAQMGLDGWELVAVTTGAWHFKRPLMPKA
jgi:hypothetical protein